MDDPELHLLAIFIGYNYSFFHRQSRPSEFAVLEFWTPDYVGLFSLKTDSLPTVGNRYRMQVELQLPRRTRHRIGAVSCTPDITAEIPGRVDQETSPSERVIPRYASYFSLGKQFVPMSDAIEQLSALGIVRRIRDGDLSPTTVTEVILDRIEETNERTNSFVTVTDELAREMAAEAERTITKGDPVKPLHGVPVAIKDLDNVAGVTTTSGSLLFEDRIAEADDPMVARLKDAGAIIVGKTNTPEFGLGTTTDNRVAGRTSTPFDLDRVSGGSSGGSAAALADLLVPIAQGSDAGGSIRLPAAFCGVYGLKPTYGLIPKADRPNAFASHTPFSHLGPMARTVEDAAVMLDVMAGPHPSDPFSIPASDDYAAAVDRPIDDVTIAYSPDMGAYPIEPVVEDVCDEAVFALEEAGATVERIDPDFEHSSEEILDAYYTFAKVRWKSLFDVLESSGFDPRGEDRDRLRPYLVDLIMNADEPTTREYKEADVVRTTVFDDLQTVFESYDLFVTATTSVLPFPHGEEPDTVAGVEIDPYRGWALTQPYNFTGHPAASIPAGFVDGLPVGMQIAGQRHADAAVIAASAAFERIRPWHDAYEA